MSQTQRCVGPYELLELLGQGGMGQVWRARHEQTGETVALKTLRTSTEGQLRSLRREVHALTRLRHPGIVRILDEGLEQGVPWYAMELLEGRSLLRWRASMGTAPTPSTDTRTWWTLSLESSAAATPTPDDVSPHDALDRATRATDPAGPASTTASPRVLDLMRRLCVPASQTPGDVPPLEALARAPRFGVPAGPAIISASPSILDLMRRLCAPLAYLHGEGLVHCDLKPGNVVVRTDGMPVLVDFGLAGVFAAGLSREALELKGPASGTVSYMAPEQIRGELLDARADLYALGCVLYELLTGRPPFVGKTPLEVFEQHLRARPVPPSSFAKESSPELDALVLRLLEKEPRRRFGHADDVARALAAIGAEAGAWAAEPPRVYLYRPGLSGREEPMRWLQERLVRLQEHDAGGLVLLAGESGVGKTRLLLELGRDSVKRRLQVLGGECQNASGAPLEALRRLLQGVADRCRARGENETERLLGRRGKVLGMYEPTLLGLPGQDRYPEPDELPAQAARLRLYSDLAETLTAFAEEAPLVLLLDDLQWADEMTLGFLEHFRRTLHSGRLQLLLVGAYRTEEIGDALGALLGSPGVELMRLGRLEERAVAAMVAEMLALEPAPALFSRFLARHSEGNPFFVAEYLRTAVAERLLWRDAQGLWHVGGPDEQPASEDDYEALALPHSLRELVGRRLESLGSEARELAEVASVLGREIEERLLASVSRMEASRLLEATRELLARQVFEETSAGQLRFAHDKLREAAYERIGSTPRRALHHAAAEAIEACYGDQREERLPALGHHWEQAGVQERARDCYLAGARHAKSRFALDGAERLYRAYLALLEESSAESAAARNELALEVLYVQGRAPESIGELEGALQEARELGERGLEGRSLWGLGGVLRVQGRVEEARRSSEQGLAISREIGDRRVEAGCLMYLASLCAEQGRLEEAAGLNEQALAIFRSMGDRRSEGIVLGNLANVCKDHVRFEEACALYEQALAILRIVGDRRNEALLLGNLAAVHDDHGRLDKAGALFEQALSLHRAVGARQSEGIVLGNLGSLYIKQGRLEETAALHEQALAIHRTTGNRRHEALALGNLAEVYGQQGRVEEADALFEQALAIAHAVGDRRVEGGFLRAAAALSRRCQRHVQNSEALLGRAKLCLREAGDKLQFTLCLCERSHLALASGSVDRELLDEAELTATSLALTAESELSQAIARVRRAQEAFEAGQHERLFQGELVEDLPAGLRRWLVETGRLTRERALLPAD